MRIANGDYRERDPDWCEECNCPIGYGPCMGCCAAAGVDMDDGREPCCENCGKSIYDFSDLGCSLCDARHPMFGCLP